MLDEPTDTPPGAEATSLATATVDLDELEADLAAVAVALARLDEGTYWACEVCGDHLATGNGRDPLRFRCPEHEGF